VAQGGDQISQLSQKAQAELGLPAGFKWWSPFPFGGINQQDAGNAINDAEFQWLENMIRLGAGYLRSMWGLGPALYTATGSLKIVYFFWFAIDGVPYCAVFLSDGTAVQVDILGAVTSISSAVHTFYISGGYLPATVQWGTQYLIISNNNTPNDYWVWDGTLLYTAGQIGPSVTLTDSGSGYTTLPTITADGGHGSGATFVPTINAGSVTSVSVTNPGTGYEPGDQVQLAFSGGGSDTSAELTAVLAATSGVNSIVITSPGVGYSTAPVITFTGGGGGSGAAAYAVLGTGAQAGQVVQIIITDPGSGYADSPTVVLTGGGYSTIATAVAALAASGVASVTVVNGGTGYNGTPTLTFVGGGGSGATAIAIMDGGVIASVTMNLSGSGYTSAPAVVVETAINNAAAATVTLMPFGISGSALETFQTRLWIFHPFQVGAVSNSGDFSVSVTGDFTNFATTEGGLQFQNTNRFLRAAYVAGRQTSSYLYTFGDSSTDVISNVQTTGSPATTTFNDQNTDPQVGTAWRDSIQDFARTEVFGSPFGIYGLYGGSVTKISDKLDRIFADSPYPPGLIPTPNTNPLTPTSAVAHIFGIKCYLLLRTIYDPFLLANRNVCLVWNEKEFFILTQEKPLTFIGTREVISALTAWGTDGTSLYQLMAQPSDALTKTLRSKMYGAPNMFVSRSTLGFYLQASDNANEGLVFDGTVETWGVVPSNEGPMPFSSNLLPPIAFSAPAPAAPMFAVNAGELVQVDMAENVEDYSPAYGQHIGFTLSSTNRDFAIYNVGLSYRDESGVA
jgi:hypothetical protein